MKITTFQMATLALLVIAPLLGCGEGLDPAAIATRDRILLKSEPEKAVTLDAAREDAKSKPKVVVTGRITAAGGEPWVTGKASFIITELLEEDAHSHGPDHNPDDCPFCKHKASKAPMASVQFLDEQGKIL